MRAARVPVVCSIGSTDPTAGAGLFVDASVYARLGVEATFVVTGITAQNSRRVSAVEPVRPSVVAAQLQSVWEQIRPNAVRIGLIPGAAAMGTVAAFLAKHQKTPIVFDPVLRATSGRRFVNARQLAAMRSILDVVSIVTPNAAEAQELAGVPVRSVLDAERAALTLAARTKWVLVTGGHLPGSQVVDVLAHAGRIRRLRGRRIAREMRGTGCVLAAAIAAFLAKGDAMEVAVRRARSFVRREIARATGIGRGRPQLAPRGARS